MNGISKQHLICKMFMAYLVYTTLYCLFLGRVKENAYANHTASKTYARSGMSLSLIVIMMSGSSDETSLKSISS